jgi:ADP-ribose pyrophosphatase YjhB (NUDIX family)
VLIGEEGRLLLNRRATEPGLGRWSFPSGYVDRGEKVEDAAIREVREETGLDVSLGRLIGVYSEVGNPVILIVYAADAWRGEAEAGPEAFEVGWFAPAALPPMAFAHDDQIIRDWQRCAATTPSGG